MKNIFMASVTVIVATASLPAAASDDVSRFYSGKSIQLAIGYGVGGGYDAYARALARHMGRHIPGNPNIVPQNMPGAGSRVAANWLYNVASKDGSAMAMVGQNTPLDQALRERGIQFDAAKFNWIGNPIVDNNYTFAWASSGLRSMEDVLKKGGLICGGSGATSPSVLNPQILNNLFNANIRIISGYPGGNEVNLAMERGEVNCRGSNSWASVKATLGQALKEKKLSFLVEWGLDPEPEVAEYMGGKVPLITDLVTDENDRQALELIVSGSPLGRPLIAPPDVPADRIDALRRGFDRTVIDAIFLAEAKKLDLDINPLPGERLQKVAAQTVNAPEAIVERARMLIRPGKIEDRKK
jgi:tripartite-type tricarboxylate transporter receptor subunit TctC